MNCSSITNRYLIRAALQRLCGIARFSGSHLHAALLHDLQPRHLSLLHGNRRCQHQSSRHLLQTKRKHARRPVHLSVDQGWSSRLPSLGESFFHFQLHSRPPQAAWMYCLLGHRHHFFSQSECSSNLDIPINCMVLVFCSVSHLPNRTKPTRINTPDGSDLEPRESASFDARYSPAIIAAAMGVDCRAETARPGPVTPGLAEGWAPTKRRSLCNVVDVAEG
jgi:hypothetical protein